MIEWTFRSLPATDINWRPVGTSFSGPQSLSGRTRFVETSGGGSWLCDISSPILKRSQVKLARALRGLLLGGAAPLILRTCECGYAPYPAGSESGGVPFSDGSTFSDGTLFAGWRINIYAAAASIHANTLTLDIQAASTDLVGSAFSIVYPTLGEHRHEIVGINDNVATIVPNIWEDIPAGTELNFDAPGCRVHCMNASEALSSINLGRFATLTLQFEEDFPEPA